MKKSSILCLITFSLLQIQIALANDSTHADPPAPAAVRLNPEVIRQQLLSRNINIMEALKQVHDAKDQVGIARGKLLPSVNLQALASFAAGPAFALSQIQFLVPFLFPSNWFNYFESGHNFDANMISYKILELNLYSSALSVYYTVLADVQYEKVYQQKSKDLQAVAEIQRRSRELLGLASQEDVLQADATAKLAMSQAKAFSELIKREIASLRKGFGYPLTTQITLDDSVVPVSEWESKPMQATVDQVNLVAPEMQQLNDLVAAAKDGKWSQVFGFLGSLSASALSTATVNSGQPTNASFGNMKVTGNASIGADYWPGVRISNRNIEEIKLRITDLTQENTRIVESSVGSIQDANSQFQLSSAAEASLLNVYNARVKEYHMGLTSLVTVLVARAQLAAASVSRIQAATDLNQLRITLHRALVTDQFANIKGCDVSNLRAKGKSPWYKNVFKSSAHARLEDMCYEGGAVVPETK